MFSEIYDSMPEFDNAQFSFKSYSALFPLFLAHGLIFEVELFMFTDRHLLLFPFPSFTSFLFVLYSFSCTVFESLSLYLGVHWGMMEVLI